MEFNFDLYHIIYYWCIHIMKYGYFTRNIRRLCRWYLCVTWKSKLPRGERICLNYWGATGNSKHWDGCFVYDD